MVKRQFWFSRAGDNPVEPVDESRFRLHSDTADVAQGDNADPAAERRAVSLRITPRVPHSGGSRGEGRLLGEDTEGPEPASPRPRQLVAVGASEVL